MVSADLFTIKAEAAFARKNLRKWLRRQRISMPLAHLPDRAFVQHDPLGMAAVAAGNCVVKASELAAAASALIATLAPATLTAGPPGGSR